MNVEAFCDSNVFLYSASKDAKDRPKAARAYDLITSVNFGISMQVVQEFYHNVQVKARLGISEPEAEAVIDLMLQRPMVVTDRELFSDARAICQRYQIAYWDATIIAAAARLGAHECYSEDLNHGQSYAGVHVINPFRNL